MALTGWDVQAYWYADKIKHKLLSRLLVLRYELGSSSRIVKLRLMQKQAKYDQFRKNGWIKAKGLYVKENYWR